MKRAEDAKAAMENAAIFQKQEAEWKEKAMKAQKEKAGRSRNRKRKHRSSRVPFTVLSCAIHCEHFFTVPFTRSSLSTGPSHQWTVLAAISSKKEVGAVCY